MEKVAMLRVNRKLEYALIALKHIASKEPGQLSSAREIALQYKTPFDTTAKIMQLLGRAQVLQSSQGVKGGYLLKRNLAEINFIELSEIVEQKKFDFSCEDAHGPCELLEVCNIKSPLKAINSKLVRFFSGVSLQELLRMEER